MKNIDMNKIPNNTLLSICIPTYNRSEFLQENLNQILNQGKGFFSEIEVLIGNNGSSDNTAEVLKNFPNIKVFDIDFNNGINPILLLLSKHAKGKYIWLLGDDDIPNDGLIELILKILKENKNFNISIFLEGSIYTSIDELIVKKKKNSIFKKETLNKIESEVIKKSGFISSNIINRKIYLSKFQKSLSINYKNAYATKYACLSCHRKSQKILKIRNALNVGRIKGMESHFVSNPDKVIKTFLFDEFSICNQLYSDGVLNYWQLIININNILSVIRLTYIIKALTRKIIILTVIISHFVLIFILGFIKTLFNKIKFTFKLIKY